MDLTCKIEGDTLETVLATNGDLSVVARMESALLACYGSHNRYPVALDRKSDALLFRFVRGGSDHGTYFAARKALEGFGVVWTDGLHGHVPEASLSASDRAFDAVMDEKLHQDWDDLAREREIHGDG